jgi:hypothetical protein
MMAVAQANSANTELEEEISEKDRALVMGRNMQRLFNL